MVVTDPETSISKKSKHRKTAAGEIINTPKKKTASDSLLADQDESATYLDKSSSRISRPKTISSSQMTNGNISDSETDIDKPPRETVVRKSVTEMRSVNSNRHSQSLVQKSDTDDDSDSNDNEPQSMSLLQMRSIDRSPVKKSNHSVHRSQISNSEILSTNGAAKSKVIRKPNVPEMSSSESESCSEEEGREHQHRQTQLQTSRSLPNPESEEEHHSEKEDEETEEEEGQTSQQHPKRVPALDSSMRIKEESSSYEEDDPSPLEEFHSTPYIPNYIPTDSNSINFQWKIPQGASTNTSTLSSKQLNDIISFEQEHTRVSAPVIDIPHDSRVWLLQVPRSIDATHLYGQHLPKKLQGGEVLKLPSGRWQILEQPHEASKSTLNCVLSTGNFCYGMRCFQPNGFWFFKRIRKSIRMETTNAPWEEEVAPLPIKDLLKMKSTREVQHLKPSKKRFRDSDPDGPSKRLKTVMTDGGELKIGKKRKHNSEVNEESPTKKKRKSNTCLIVDSQSHLPVIQAESKSTTVTNSSKSLNSSVAKDISISKKEKKRSKHKESGDDSTRHFSTTEPGLKLELKNSAIDNEAHSSLHKQPQNSSDKKHKKNSSHVKQEVEDQFLGMKHTETEETPKRKRKRKEKQSTEGSEYEEIFQSPEKKKKRENLSSSVSDDKGMEKSKNEKKKHFHQNETSLVETDTDGIKKKKHKHQNRMESAVSVQGSEEDNTVDISVKKKHKHKHKDLPKTKQEGFWERETSPNFLSRLYLTQVVPEDL